jgi:hypothetical protein
MLHTTDRKTVQRALPSKAIGAKKSRSLIARTAFIQLPVTGAYNWMRAPM